jgi:hypothetical protein
LDEPLSNNRSAFEHIRPPSIAEFDRWQRASGDLVKLVTMSPHFDETPNYIAALRDRGILVSIGHTHASPEQIHAAVDAGATLSTHLGNGVDDPLPRKVVISESSVGSGQVARKPGGLNGSMQHAAQTHIH